MVLIIAAVSATFHRAQLCKLLLPISEHMRFYTAQFADFANGEVAFCRDGRKRILQLNQYAIEESSKFTLSPNLAQRVCCFIQDVLRSHTNDTICLQLTPALRMGQCDYKCQVDSVILYLVFQLMTGVKCNYTSSLNKDRLASSRVATGPSRLGTNLKIAKT